MTGALALLAADHERILELSTWLTGGAGDPPPDLRERQHVAEQLVMEVSRHDAAEEQLFWPLVRRRVPGGDDLARAALEQEGGAKRLLHELGHMSPGDEDFRTLCFRVASHLRDQLTYEQNQIWPKLQLHVPNEELEQLGERLELAKRTAPTRPHPHLPADPKLLATVGTAVAFVDRARDAVTRRGR